jgi:hypothetical protein
MGRQGSDSLRTLTRVSRRCVFCGSDRPLTREHVWPQWLRGFPAYDELLRVSSGSLPPAEVPLFTRSADGRFHAESRKRGRTPLLPDVTVKRVCASCNNGWMAGLENEARPILVKMIEARERFKLSKYQCQVLIHWAVKTLMMYVLYYPEEHQVFTTEDYVAFFDSRQIPVTSCLWVGMSHSPYAYVAAGYTPHLFTNRDVTDGELLGPPNGASFSVALHEVFFVYHFVRPPVPVQVITLPVRLLAELQQLYPGSRRVRWPPRELHNDEFLAVRDYLRNLVNAVGLPTEGLTLQDSQDAARQFFDQQIHPRDIRRHFDERHGG